MILFFINYIEKEKYKNEKNNINIENLVKEEITIVTCLYYIKSKRTFYLYLNWVNNFLKLTKPIVFFIDPNIYYIVKKKRNIKFQNKTIFIKLNLKDFYTYQKYHHFFSETNKKDKERYHTIDLYHVWAEKVVFLKKAIKANLFKSKCFYWIDAGMMRDKNYPNEFLEKWPSINKCNEDPRVTFFGVRNLSLSEIKDFKSLKINQSFFRKDNVAGNIFGGDASYILEFYKKYFETIEIWYKNGFFIGKDQNVFASVIYLYPNICKIIQAPEDNHWHYSFEYFK